MLVDGHLLHSPNRLAQGRMHTYRQHKGRLANCLGFMNGIGLITAAFKQRNIQNSGPV